MIYKIYSRWDGKVLFEREGTSLREVVIAAVESGANLSGADLSDADLRGADLRDADLSGADLRGADLSRADLSRADLSDADLRGADLRDADLSGADLRGADLSRADLSRADLSDADLRGADLSGADLSRADLSRADLSRADLSRADLCGADLRGAKQDLWEILLRAPKEIAGLKQALIEGHVNGSCYEGECACLIGTIANVRHIDHTKLGTGLEPNASRPAERWFLAIRKGDTQETNPVVALTVEWIDEFQALLANAVKP